MKKVVEKLLAMQDLVLQSGDPAPDVQLRIEALRKKVPESLLIKFDHWMARRRKAVAVVRNGVCGECHLQLAVGVVVALAVGGEIQRCGNCGRFLSLSEDEPACPPSVATRAKPARRRKEAAGHVR